MKPSIRPRPHSTWRPPHERHASMSALKIQPVHGRHCMCAHCGGAQQKRPN